MPLSGFHPSIERWFASRFPEPTEPQRRAWPVIQRGSDVLIAAPTGSGKTFAAFLSAIDGLVRQGLKGELRDETQVLYVSPLKALSNDIQKNLSEPLAEIRAMMAEQGGGYGTSRCAPFCARAIRRRPTARRWSSSLRTSSSPLPSRSISS